MAISLVPSPSPCAHEPPIGNEIISEEFSSFSFHLGFSSDACGGRQVLDRAGTSIFDVIVGFNSWGARLILTLLSAATSFEAHAAAYVLIT